jgi:hypothetical protein
MSSVDNTGDASPNVDRARKLKLRQSTPNLLQNIAGGSSPKTPRKGSDYGEDARPKLDEDLVGLFKEVVRQLGISQEDQNKLTLLVDTFAPTENYSNAKKQNILRSVRSYCQNTLDKTKNSKSVICIQSYIRGWNEVKSLQRLRKLYSPVSWPDRNTELRDLFAKEKEYVNVLEKIVNDYLIPLREEKILKVEHIQSIFSNVETLLFVHKEFFKKIMDLRLNWPHITGVGSAFIRTAASLSCYSNYVENISHATLTFQKLSEENDRFRTFLEKTAAADKSGMPLSALLFYPLNRISQYKIGLENLLQKTPRKHSDYNQLARACDMMQNAYTFIEKSMALSKNRAAILEVQRRLGMESNELVQTGREYIFEGQVQMFKKGKKHPRLAILFNDMLLLAKSSEKATDNIKYKAIIYFTSQDEVHSETDKDGKFPLRLDSYRNKDDEENENDPKEKEKDSKAKENMVSYRLIFGTEKERKDWHELINKQLNSVKIKSTNVFGCPLSELLKKDTKNPKIPLVVKTLITELEKHLTTTGLFRVPGRENENRRLKEALDTLEPVNLDLTHIDPLAMADVLKIYFRELPDPIFTFDMYDKFMNLETEATSEEDYHKRLLILVNQLPQDNRNILVCLIKFLLRICAVKENLMSTASLAIIWAPTLLFPRRETIESTFLMPRGHKMFQVLMDNFSFYFQEELPAASTRAAKKKKKKSVIQSQLTRGEKWMLETFALIDQDEAPKIKSSAAQATSTTLTRTHSKQPSNEAIDKVPVSPKQSKQPLKVATTPTTPKNTNAAARSVMSSPSGLSITRTVTPVSPRDGPSTSPRSPISARSPTSPNFSTQNATNEGNSSPKDAPPMLPILSANLPPPTALAKSRTYLAKK